MTTQKISTETPKKLPIHTIQDALVKVKIWEHEGENGKYWNVQPIRIYKKAENDWREAKTFAGTDILRVTRLLDEAYDYIETLKNNK